MFVCVAEIAELLVFFTFFLHLPHFFHRSMPFFKNVLKL